MAPIIHFEVYFYDMARGWTLHSRHPSDERDRAIKEAKTLEATLGQPVKVIRETFDTSGNDAEEQVVYLSEKIRHIHSAQRNRNSEPHSDNAPVRRPGGGHAAEPDLSRYSFDTRHRSRSDEDALVTPMNIWLRLFLVITSSLLLSIVITILAWMVIDQLPLMNLSMSASQTGKTLFGVFLATFTFTSIPLILFAVPFDEMDTPAQDPKSNGETGGFGFFDFLFSRKTAPSEKKALPALKTYDPSGQTGEPADSGTESAEERGASARASASPPDLDDTEIIEDAPEEPEAKKSSKDDEKESKAREAAEKQRKAAEEKAAELAERERQAKEERKKLEEEKARFEAERKAEKTYERQRLSAMKFLGGVVGSLRQIRPNLDSYNRFGMNLVLAGAIAELSRSRKLREQDTDRLMREALEVMGSSPALAQSFIDRLDATLLEDDRYQEMVLAGHELMRQFLDGGADPKTVLAKSMAGWNEDMPSVRTVITLLFVTFARPPEPTVPDGADEAGATGSETARGPEADAAAAGLLVNALAPLFKNAASTYGGSPAGQTADGLLASFTSASAALEAAIVVQQAVRDDAPDAEPGSESAPARHAPAIGLHAGETKPEESDLFDHALGRAARHLARSAAPGQILLTGVVHDLAGHGQFRMLNQGPRSLDEGRDTVSVFELDWWDYQPPVRPQQPLPRAADPAAAEVATDVPTSQDPPDPPPAEPSVAKS